MLLDQLQDDFIRALYSGQLAEADSMIKDNALLSANSNLKFITAASPGHWLQRWVIFFRALKWL